MNEFHKNPSADIWRILDESGLTLANLQRTDRSQTKTVNEVRLELHSALKKYIKYREARIGGQITQSDTTMEVQI